MIEGFTLGLNVPIIIVEERKGNNSEICNLHAAGGSYLRLAQLPETRK